MTCRERAVVAAAAGLLFFYLFLRPGADAVSLAMILAIWAASMAYDLRLTLAHASLIPRYERSLLLAFLHSRIPGSRAVALAVSAEAACVALLPAAFLLEMDPGSSMATAYLFAMLHMAAVSQNERFLRSARA